MKFLFNIFLILFFFSSVSAKDHLQFFIDAALTNNLKLNAERKNQKSIKENITMMISCIEETQSYRISIEKRNSEIKSTDLISEIAELIPNKVSLEQADWEIVIQIMGKTTGIGILPKNSIISVSKEKRLSSY